MFYVFTLNPIPYFAMPKFPTKEDEIIALAQQMFKGLRNNLLVWPDPPVRGIFLGMKRNYFLQCHGQAVAARAAAASAYTVRQEALDELSAAMKNNLRYAENTVNFDDHKLKLIGWSGRRQAAAIVPPGQVRRLQIVQKPNGAVKLIWQPPRDGGQVNAYEVQRRQAGDNSGWRHLATALTGEMILREQPAGDYLEYRVRAINKVGHGQMSNTVIYRSQMIML